MKIDKSKTGSFLLFLLISFGIHVCVIVSFFVSNYFWSFFGEKKQFLMPPSIRIDSIGLPDPPAPSQKDTRKEEARPIPKETKIKEEARPIPKETKIKEEVIPTLKKTKIKQKESKKKEDKKKDKETDEKKRAEQKKSEQAPIDSKEESLKGNQLNKKGKKEGEDTASEDVLSAIYTYAEMIKQKIRANWDLPKYLTEINLTTQIELKINPDGSIFYKNIHLSSGNDLFDGYVLKAIEKAAPYPPSPDTAKKYIQKAGFVLTVPSQN